jgi:hypothetical protein
MSEKNQSGINEGSCKRQKTTDEDWQTVSILLEMRIKELGR